MTYKFYLGLCEYFATGEGVHYYILGAFAEDEETFTAAFAKEYGDYYAIGLDIFQDKWPENHTLLDQLTGRSVKSIMSRFLQGEERAPAFLYKQSYYVNYS